MKLQSTPSPNKSLKAWEISSAIREGRIDGYPCDCCNWWYATPEGLREHQRYIAERDRRQCGRVLGMKEELANISKKDYDMWYEALAKMCHPGLEFLRTHGFTVEELSESAIRGERSCRDCNLTAAEINHSGAPLPCLYHAGEPIPPVPEFHFLPESMPAERLYTCCSKSRNKWCLSHPAHRFGNTPTTQYARAPAHKPAMPKRRAVIIDCEMGIDMGLKLELIQVCVIDFFSGRILLCSVVEPPTPLLHLNTKYSGVTASFFAGAVREGDVISSRRDVREKIWEYVDDQTVIVGHDLRNDFEKLRIIHEMVLDTSLLTMEFGNRRGLATLAREIGGLEIRKGDGEHCVSEDTMATRQVAIKLIEEKSGLVAGVGLENWW